MMSQLTIHAKLACSEQQDFVPVHPTRSMRCLVCLRIQGCYNRRPYCMVVSVSFNHLLSSGIPMRIFCDTGSSLRSSYSEELSCSCSERTVRFPNRSVNVLLAVLQDDQAFVAKLLKGVPEVLEVDALHAVIAQFLARCLDDLLPGDVRAQWEPNDTREPLALMVRGSPVVLDDQFPEGDAWAFLRHFDALREHRFEHGDAPTSQRRPAPIPSPLHRPRPRPSPPGSSRPAITASSCEPRNRRARPPRPSHPAPTPTTPTAATLARHPAAARRPPRRTPDAPT
jgi:hypothetical protein